MFKPRLRPALTAAGMLAICGALAVAILVMDMSHPAAALGGISAAAVVTLYGTGARDPASLVAINGINAAAELRKIVSKFTITNGNSIASKYMIGEVPADAILSPGGTIYFGAVTGAADVDVGVAYPNGGAMIVADCIVNGHDIHLAGSTTLAAATGSGVATPANMAKRVWELAGLTSNPGGNLALWMTINAAATATADVLADLTYAKGA